MNDWVGITQFWINAGIVYVAIFDRAWLWDAIRPILKAVERTALAAGNLELARILRAMRFARRIDKEGKAEAPTVASPAVLTPTPPAASAPSRGEPGAPAQPRKPRGHGTLVFGLVVALIVGGVITKALWFPDEVHIADESDGNGDDTERAEGGAAPYRIVLPPEIGTVWAASRACTGSGGRWRELQPLNPGLRVDGDLVIINERDQALMAPGDWLCPRMWVAR